jgi:hypothetical protein
MPCEQGVGTSCSRSGPGKTKPNGSPAKLEAETNKAWDNHGRNGCGTRGRSRPCYSRAGCPWYGCVAASPRLRGGDIATDRTSAPNKPNFGKSHFEDKCCADKDLQCIGRGENPRKTKPISRSGAPRRCRPWRPSGAPIFQYSIIPAFQFHADRAKRSQTLAPLGYLGARRAGGSLSCKTKPISVGA